ncbi:uncharacterized protein LOC118184188 [Stegodyphus dumicola]|uniref:uncharacterized protein LOC118184188 n=1 Tax=Stegodyphus dumicola TaxID=202533 RepID=UPI0015AEBBA4|nr:uncharacterized protein LOC118184188 [Stegodyphus dumicola]
MEMANSSRKHACARIQACIAYLCKYFELAFDFLVLEAVLHILEDSRTYFCSLSEHDQICFVTECFRPFVSCQKFLEYPLGKLENCILNKEEADLVFIAYLLLYKEEIHFSKIFKCFEDYGVTVSMPGLSTSEQMTYFQKRKKYFCIRSDGFVALNHISELNASKSSFSNCFNMFSKVNRSKNISLFRKNQNQPIAHDVHDFILTQCSYTQSKARDNNSNLESTNDAFLGDKTTKTDIFNAFDVRKCNQNSYISENVCHSNHVLNKILSSYIFLSEFLHESAFNFDRLKIILHVFGKLRKYFCNLSFTEQKHFIKQICRHCHRKSTSCLDNNLNSRQICKLSEKRKVLLHITHLLYPNKKIHFSELLKKLNIFYNIIDCLSTANMQLAFFEKTKKYFIIENDGLVELNLAPDLKILNAEIFHDCISPINPDISTSLAPLEQKEKNAVKLNEDYATLKTKPSNIPPSITEGEGSFNEHSEAHKTAEEIITSPSSELDRIFKLLARKEENIQKKDDTTIPFILRDSPNIFNLSKKSSGQANEVYTMSDVNLDTSKKNCGVIEKKPEIMVEKMDFDSSKQNNHSINDASILANKQEDNFCCRQKMEIPSNYEIMNIPDSVKELEQNIHYETLDTSENLICNSLKDEPVDYSLSDKTVNDCVTPKKEKTDFRTVLYNKTGLCDNITDKSVTSAAVSITEPTEMLHNFPGENSHFKSNNTKVPDSYSCTSNNFENHQEALKAIKIDTANEAKNIICLSNIPNNEIKTSEHALPNISSATEIDFHTEYSQETSDNSPPVNGKEISNLQKIPKQSPKFVKYPTEESQLSISKEAAYTYLNTSAFLLSDHSEDYDFGFIKPHPFLFDNIAYGDYCEKIVDSILGPLNFPTSKRLESEELKSHNVTLCLKELVKLEKRSNFRLNISEKDGCFAKKCFQTTKAYKHSEKERRVVNFFIVILGKYCSGLSLKMLHTYLQIASKEVVQYLNDCYKDNLLHFFRENENYFYISPISRNIYLRK